MYRLDPESLKIVVEQAVLWSGYLNRNNLPNIYTAEKSTADALQFALQAVSDTVVSLVMQDRRGTVFPNGNTLQKSVRYCVYASNFKGKTVLSSHVERQDMPNGKQYCFTTSTGYWLSRRDDFIWVTGNSGKGRSVGIMEDQVTHLFRERFLGEAFILKADTTISQLAIRRAKKKVGGDPDEERTLLMEEFFNHGTLLFSFDSATEAAIKQMRHKLLMAGSGSMNLEIDEIGSNLLGNQEALTTYLQLFDMGRIKQKLTKHTKDNRRSEELFGITPTNMLLFGTPTKLLDGSKVEDQFYEMLETGYARRCFFGYSRMRDKSHTYTAEEIYDILTDTKADEYLLDVAVSLQKLATINNMSQVMVMDKAVTLQLLEYRLYCDKIADTYSDYDEVRKAELKHRYFKVAKLAAVYAYISNQTKVTEDNLYEAIAIAEQSGHALDQILSRDRPWVKLANYICTINREVTQADLAEDLPFYKGTESQKRDMMTLAIAHGYQNNLIIKKSITEGIEFFSGKSLAQTDLSELILSYSQGNFTTGYVNAIGRWPKLQNVCTAVDVHWCNHTLLPDKNNPADGGYRDEAHVKPGFNLVVLDIENSVSIQVAELLLNEYCFYIHTTKRHTEQAHRFRMILPLSHVLELDDKDYKAFMEAVFDWLPFDVDRSTGQRSRKWASHENPTYQAYHDGILLDAYKFIPKTKKAEEQKKQIISMSAMSNLERWFAMNCEEGARNNMLLRYAFALADNGQDFDSIRNNVLAFNAKIAEPLPETEVLSTILVTIAKKLQSHD
jgi:hypothetical protein